MAIEYVYGDIMAAKTEALVNPVNCVGVMGKGLAEQFKLIYPGMFKEYKQLCDNQWFKPGQVFMYLVPGGSTPKFIMCAATKGHWRDKSNRETIQTCVLSIYNLIVKYNIQSIAVPALGCGEGGMSWLVVQDIIYEGLKCFHDVQIHVYPPHVGEQTVRSPVSHGAKELLRP